MEGEGGGEGRGVEWSGVEWWWCEGARGGKEGGRSLPLSCGQVVLELSFERVVVGTMELDATSSPKTDTAQIGAPEIRTFFAQ